MKPTPTSLLQPLHILGKGVVWCKSNNAAGQKVKKSANLGTIDNVSGTSFTDYLGGYQYNNDVLQFFPHAQGYVKHTINPSNGASEFDYVYQYKDHLGNIRINYTFDTASSSLKVLEENHYYPFGLKHTASLNKRDIVFEKELQLETSPWIKSISLLGDTKKGIIVPNSGYQYKYNGKEWQDELGINVYDMDMRQYDPAIARWVVQDPIVHHSMSPYNAFDNNPVFWADPSGADATSRPEITQENIDNVNEINSKFKKYLNERSNSNKTEKLINFTFDNTKEKSNWTNNDDGTFSGEELENTDPDKILFYRIGNKGLSQTAAIIGIDKLLYLISAKDGGTFAFAYFVTHQPYYFNLPGHHTLDDAAMITSRAIDTGFDVLQKEFVKNEGSISPTKMDYLFRDTINKYMKVYGGSVSITPTKGFKGYITKHED